MLEGRHLQTGAAILERPIKIGVSRGFVRHDWLAEARGSTAARGDDNTWESRLTNSLQRFGLSLADFDTRDDRQDAEPLDDDE